ncbi:hypothetical protein CesoFtcFv8_005547 [Champsocephalus esox]|uniref:Uncharacterized protein n=1 Tax=Champsocephalus esox TaxID=159716 RepID=A0AAN8CQ61_9TELE|nr:hypothetical protein CesoFtcFv8_005547 [Champsocephalus esox]
MKGDHIRGPNNTKKIQSNTQAPRTSDPPAASALPRIGRAATITRSHDHSPSTPPLTRRPATQHFERQTPNEQPPPIHRGTSRHRAPGEKLHPEDPKIHRMQ